MFVLGAKLALVSYQRVREKNERKKGYLRGQRNFPMRKRESDGDLEIASDRDTMYSEERKRESMTWCVCARDFCRRVRNPKRD